MINAKHEGGRKGACRFNALEYDTGIAKMKPGSCFITLCSQRRGRDMATHATGTLSMGSGLTLDVFQWDVTGKLYILGFKHS